MSKKNNRTTRANSHAFKLAKEKEQEDKRKQKQLKQQRKQQQEQAGSGTAPQLGVKAKSKGIKIKAKNRVKLKKNKVVRGIKITDAESKRQAKELLAAEQAMHNMLVDSAEPAKKKRKK